jgi:2-succinyl-6-hydroxy-2,4-cyclohexadiene-1-carboxylate synthase
LWATAELLKRTVAATAGRAAGWVGYSMGGRMALHVALAYPAAVPKLALISTSAGIGDDAERAARRAADEALAKRLDGAGPQGLHDFLEGWLAQPLFATLPRERAGLDERLTNSPAGLASSLRLAGAGVQEPLWDRLGELRQRELPVLFIAGELDPKYTKLAHAMADAIGRSAEVHMVRGAGHACHLERPEEVATELARFFDAGG